MSFFFRIDNLGRLWSKGPGSYYYGLIPDAPRLLNYDNNKCNDYHVTVDNLIYSARYNKIIDCGQLRFSWCSDHRRLAINAITTDGNLYNIFIDNPTNPILCHEGIEYLGWILHGSMRRYIFLSKSEGWCSVGLQEIVSISGSYIPGVISCSDNILTTTEGYYIAAFHHPKKLSFTKLDVPENIISITTYEDYMNDRIIALILTSSGELFEYDHNEFRRVNNSIIEMLNHVSPWTSIRSKIMIIEDKTDNYCEIINRDGQKFKIISGGLIDTTYDKQNILRTYQPSVKNSNTKI